MKRIILKDREEHIVLDETVADDAFNSSVDELKAMVGYSIKTVDRGHSWQVLQTTKAGGIIAILLQTHEVPFCQLNQLTTTFGTHPRAL